MSGPIGFRSAVRALPVEGARQPPPKPSRQPPAPTPEDDDTTIRVLLGDVPEAHVPVPPHLGPRRSELTAEPTDAVGTATPGASVVENPVPPPPPLPGNSSPSEKARLILADLSTRLGAVLRRAAKERYAKIGAGIFGAGVLVGVIGSVVVMANGDDDVANAAAPPTSAAVSKPVPLAIAAPKPATSAPPQVQASDLAVERRGPAEGEKKTADAEKGTAEAKTKTDASGAAARETVAVSASSAQTCEQLLGPKSVKRRDPKAAQRETRLANRELVLGNVPEAQAAYCKAFALDRSNIDRHVNLGRFYLFRRDWAQAAKYGQSALALDPKHRRALGVVGDAWAALDKPDEARSAWLAAERKTNADRRELNLMVRRNFALGKKVERLKDFSLAERLYRRVLLLDPKHAGAMNGIASCLLKVGDYQGAEEWARRADMVRRTR